MNKKVIIIGGGVAGLSTAIFFQNAGWQVIVKERAQAYSEVGHGFILQRNGIEVLDKLGIKKEVEQKGSYINQYVNWTPDYLEITNEPLSDNIAIRRSVLVSILEKCLLQNSIHFGYRLKSLDWQGEGDGPVLLGYENGEYEEADLVIATDGANSFVRSQIFPSAKKIDNHINELVGVCPIPSDISITPHQLLKIQDQKEGLAIGILPSTERELIWYLQYDSIKYPVNFPNSGEMKKFALKVTHGWPGMVVSILENTDFNKVHTWQTSYLELLPSFHKNNVVLLGDAAHTFVPFTSQGANSALVDADIFCSLMLSNKKGQKNWENIFDQYYNMRRNDTIKNIAFGSKMTELFIHPETVQEGETIIPLAIN